MIIYFIRAEGTEFVKIGRTTKDVLSRLLTLQTGSPIWLHLEATVETKFGSKPCSDHIVRKIAQKLGYKSHHHEWMIIPTEIDTNRIINVIEDINKQHQALTQHQIELLEKAITNHWLQKSS